MIVQNGTLSTAWPSRFNSAPAHGKGEVSPDGSVKLAIDGYTPTGRVLSGNMNGAWANDTITVTGSWNNSVPVSGTWTRVP